MYNDMTDLVRERLQAFGYEFNKADELLIKAAVRKAENAVKNECGISEIPGGLLDAAVDMAAGEFLFLKKVIAPGDITCIKLDAAVKRIEVGDTATVFAVGEGSLTEEQRFDRFVEHLLGSGKKLYSRYRRIRW